MTIPIGRQWAAKQESVLGFRNSHAKNMKDGLSGYKVLKGHAIQVLAPLIICG